jgi:NitT/TauT family transport system substrate-binding protein
MKGFSPALAAALAALAWMCAPATAQDTLKVAIGQINNWENQPATLGMQAGIFQKHGLVLETFGTQGAGETLQPIISGSADIGVGVGTSGAMRAFAKGAPVRVLGAGITGGEALFWYVRADSPIKSLKDLTENNTIAYSTSGAVTNSIVLAFVNELGVKAKPTATGGPPATLTQVMSRQIDVGWSVPPLGVEEVQQGKIRIIARGSDVPSLRDLTLTLLVVNADSLARKKEAIVRFMQAYRETLDWMYSNPDAIKFYGEKIAKPESVIRRAVEEFLPKASLSPDQVSGVDEAMAEAVKLKFLDKPLTKDELAEFIKIPPRGS